MRLYIAAPWSEKEKAAKAAQVALMEAGHEVTSRWIDRDPDPEPDYSDGSKYRGEAINDIEDIINANMVVLLNPDTPSQGRHVETGIAVAMLKPVIVVGERTNVFHHLRCPRVDTVEEAIAELKQWEPGTHKWPDVEETRGAVRR